MVQKRHSISSEKRSFSIDKDVEQEYKFEKEEGRVIVDTGPKFGKRYVEAIFIFCALFISYLIRVNVSLTIVAMTNPNANENKDVPTFNWTNRNIILSSFFWGYVIPQVMAGWLMMRYGPKWFLIGTIGTASLAGYLIPPFAIYLGSTGVIICRIIQGFCQGFMVPSIPVFMSRWVPISERVRIGSFIYAASSFGTVFAMIISGAISASTYGWPMVFHFFSTIALLWCIVYAFCGCNSPAESTSITPEERAYIEKTTVLVQKKSIRTPWKEMLTSVPFLALFYSYSCFILGFWILLTQIPTYMTNIMKFDIKSNGLLSALPYLIQSATGITMSVVSDHLTNKNMLSVGAARKTFTAIGMVFPALCLVFLGQCSSEHTVLAVTLLVLGIGINGSTLAGLFINNVDLAPNYSGVIQGFVNGFSNILAIGAPLIVQIMVKDEQNPENWKRVFYLASGFYVSGVVIFTFFGSGEVQTWNDDKKDEDTEKV